MAKTNAERQREFRERKKRQRNASNGPAAICRNGTDRNETNQRDPNDKSTWFDADGNEHFFLGRFPCFGDVWVMIVHNREAVERRDRERSKQQ